MDCRSTIFWKHFPAYRANKRWPYCDTASSASTASWRREGPAGRKRAGASSRRARGPRCFHRQWAGMEGDRERGSAPMDRRSKEIVRSANANCCSRIRRNRRMVGPILHAESPGNRRVEHPSTRLHHHLWRTSP